MTKIRKAVSNNCGAQDLKVGDHTKLTADIDYNSAFSLTTPGRNTGRPAQMLRLARKLPLGIS